MAKGIVGNVQILIFFKGKGNSIGWWTRYGMKNKERIKDDPAGLTQAHGRI